MLTFRALTRARRHCPATWRRVHPLLGSAVAAGQLQSWALRREGQVRSPEKLTDDEKQGLAPRPGLALLRSASRGRSVRWVPDKPHLCLNRAVAVLAPLRREERGAPGRVPARPHLRRSAAGEKSAQPGRERIEVLTGQALERQLHPALFFKGPDLPLAALESDLADV